MSQNYQVLGIIDRGRPGVVIYKVVDNAQARIFAMKKVCLDSEEETRSRSFVEREAKLLQRLSCSHLVWCYAAFPNEDCTTFSIVTDYCEGGNLAKHIACKKMANESFDEDEIMHWFVQVTLGLNYLHNNGILHRDLRPSNVNLTNRNVAKLCDFGFSKCVDNFLDLINGVVGSPFYQSPEACNFSVYTSKCDVWSLGCLLYELACLRPAFYLESGARTVLDRVRRGSFAKLDRRSLGLSSALTSLADELLQVSWEQRPSCRRLLQCGLVRRHLSEFRSLAEENAEERGGLSIRASGRGGGSPSPSDSPRRSGGRDSVSERPVSRMSRIQTPRPRPRWSSAAGSGGGGIVPEETDDLEDLIDMRDNGSSSEEDSDESDNGVVNAGGAGGRGRHHRGGRCVDDEDEGAEDDEDDDESTSDEEECADTEDWALVLEEARRAVEDGQSAAAAAASAPAGCYDAVADCLFDAYGIEGCCVDKAGRHVCAEYLRSVFDKGSRKG